MNEGEFEELNECGPKVFEFSGYCYVAGFSLVVWAIYYASQTPGFTMEDFVEIGFRVAAAIILPGFVAFAGWLLFGRTHWATNIIYFLAFFLIGGHGFVAITKKGRARITASALARLPVPLSGAEVLARTLSGKSTAGMSVWRKPPQTSTEDVAEINRMASLEAATRSHLSKVLTSGKQFAAAFRGLSLGKSAAGRRYGSEGQLERQILTTQLQLGLLKAFPNALENAPGDFESGLATVGLSDVEKDLVLAGYREGSERVGPRLLEFHKRVQDHGDATLEALILLADHYGAWQRDSGSRQTVFESKDAQATFDEILEELEMSESEIRDLRKGLGR